MFFLHRPAAAQAAAFLAEQRQAGYSYAQQGQTLHGLHPHGYASDQHRTGLGTGEACFGRAREAVQRWHMFETPWIQLINLQTPVEVGESLVAQVAHLGFYSLIADRVVYIISEAGRLELGRLELGRLGFAYGTLTGHAGQGEERFLVTLSAGGEVQFGLSAFSRRKFSWFRQLLARLGNPVVRRLQGAAAESYALAMSRAVG
jgi:uncharacterized protein (UPF0548 family)